MGSGDGITYSGILHRLGEEHSKLGVSTSAVRAEIPEGIYSMKLEKHLPVCRKTDK